MHKIDSPNATGANEFTDGDPALGVLSTVLWSKWLNTVQRELIAILTAAGVTPSAANDAQVVDAIAVLIGSHSAQTAVHGATSTATASRIILRDAFGRTKVAEGVSGDDVVVFSQFANSKLTNGYQRLPGGIIAQWGSAGVQMTSVNSTTSITVTFPLAFPSGNAPFTMVANICSSPIGEESWTVSVDKNGGATQAVILCRNSFGAGAGLATVNWFAIGH
jgi:hypothetical protein